MESTKSKSVISDIKLSFILQIVTYIAPFLILSHVTKILGVELYGIYAIAFAIVSVIIIIFDFGLSLYSIREIAKASKDKIGEILCNNIIIKIMLFLVSMPIFFYLTYNVIYFEENYWLFWYAFVFSLNLEWFFQAIRKISYQLYLRVITSVIQYVIVYCFILDKQDAYILPLSLFISWTVNLIISLFIIHRLGYRYKKPSFLNVINMISQSKYFYSNKICINLISKSATFIIGEFSSAREAAIFAIAEKIYLVGSNLILSVNRVLYPYMAKEKDLAFIRKIIFLFVLISAPVLVSSYFLSEYIINYFFGKEFSSSASVLFLFTVVFIIEALNGVVGYPVLAVYGKDKLLNKSILLSTVLHLSILFTFYIHDVEITAYNYVLSLIICFIFDMTIRFYSYSKIIKN
ncbi:oligosaccharide flippase family protein [Vibrio campbellii]|uniref:oligosaccharide flippase family protein n=1 Tax=Vibrio campbellii TaxID=680 RepID=UPI000CD34546|nr:oligosaccharide flippase family protein [Vibrio campbellii]AUW03250.1 hypothetical protein C1N51_05420 [Vibrio campbellii]